LNLALLLVWSAQIDPLGRPFQQVLPNWDLALQTCVCIDAWVTKLQGQNLHAWSGQVLTKVNPNCGWQTCVSDVLPGCNGWGRTKIVRMSADNVFYLNLGLLTGVLAAALVVYTQFVIKPILRRYA